MVRTQVQFTQSQLEALRALAAEGHVSVSELVRRAVDRLLADGKRASWEERVRRARAAFGRFRSDATDVSERHDDYLAEIWADEHIHPISRQHSAISDQPAMTGHTGPI